MPVRTDRGRVAVYRRIWGWPLRSPRHLAATAAATALLVGAVALAASAVTGNDPAPAFGPAAATTGRRMPSPGPSAPSAATSASWPAPATPPTVTSPPARPATTTPTGSAPAPAPTGAAAAASAVASKFMALWVNHPAGMSSQQWAAQLVPYVVPEYVVALESVEPANIPATTVTGQPTVTSATPTVVEVNVATNAGVVRLVVLAQHNGTWLVRSYDLAAA